MKQTLKKVEFFFRKYKEYFLVIFYIGIFIDLFYNAYFSDLFLIISLILWLNLSYFLQYTSITTFKVVLSLFFVFIVLYIVDQQAGHTERIVSWIAVFFVTGAIQQFIELRK